MAAFGRVADGTPRGPAAGGHGRPHGGSDTDSAEPCWPRCTIEDGGPGIADAEREQLFTRWARGAAGAERDGSGLGLYVSRGLVRAMDGDLVLEPSAPGRGAAFTFDLPAEPPTEG